MVTPSNWVTYYILAKQPQRQPWHLCMKKRTTVLHTPMLAVILITIASTHRCQGVCFGYLGWFIKIGHFPEKSKICHGSSTPSSGNRFFLSVAIRGIFSEGWADTSWSWSNDWISFGNAFEVEKNSKINNLHKWNFLTFFLGNIWSREGVKRVREVFWSHRRSQRYLSNWKKTCRSMPSKSAQSDVGQ